MRVNVLRCRRRNNCLQTEQRVTGKGKQIPSKTEVWVFPSETHGYGTVLGSLGLACISSGAAALEPQWHLLFVVPIYYKALLLFTKYTFYGLLLHPSAITGLNSNP